MKNMFLVMLLAASSVCSQALAEYYTVKDAEHDSQPAADRMNPMDLMNSIWKDSEGLSSEIVSRIYSLMDFTQHDGVYGTVVEPYNRSKHFGTWIFDGRFAGCMNTRAKVLVRDSSHEVSYSSSGCTVRSGLWADPYSGRDFTQAVDIQIDHFVPLKNAYISGADRWSSQKRCLYTNFMGNEFHLLSVNGKENSAKGDRSPKDYMPPNPEYRCQYLSQWLKVKLLWSLALESAEKSTILRLAQENHCDLKQFVMTSEDLDKQRQFIADNLNICK